MSDELHHECGIAALYWLPKELSAPGPLSQSIRDGDVSALMPGMLLDLQNRGQLAAGLSSFNPERAQRLSTFRGLGTVSEAFGLSHPDRYRRLMARYTGPAVIGHTRYATCGADDIRFAQPFERQHGRAWKWFCFAFNGNLANFADLRDRLLTRRNYIFALNTDTEILMHSLAYRLKGDRPPGLKTVMSGLARAFDGAYNIVFIDAMGRMLVARDPLGLRPLCWATQGRLFAAASESVPLTNMGFTDVRSLEPGEMLIVEKGRLRAERFAPRRRKAHCFFEWVYFSNVASTLDDVSVYLSRARSGRRLAEMETETIDADSIVVPVPDTAKAAADAFAYRLGIPALEGLIRNRYVGRTFIQPNATRAASARSKYTPVPAILKGKKVFLIEDSIVRSTTLAALADQLLTRGGAREIHVRVACPPIISPCFYGIDMSTLGELFAPRFLTARYHGSPSPAMLQQMARRLGVTTLRYLSVSDLGPCLGLNGSGLCQGCVTGKYPTVWGNRLMRCARRHSAQGAQGAQGRTYERLPAGTGKSKAPKGE